MKLMFFMDHNNLFRVKQLSPLIIIILAFSLIKPALSADPQFEACEPKKCGEKLTFRYPFWISYDQEPYCGHQSLEIICKDEKPMLWISDEYCLVLDISYQGQYVLVANAKAFDEGTCATPLHNITLVSDDFIRLNPDNFNLFFFNNCTVVPPNTFTYPIPCATHDHNLHTYATILHEEGMKYLNASSENCGSLISAPFEMGENDTSDTLMKMNYKEVLKKGFLLKWNSSGCAECERSGGRCGFHNNDEFICFCSDQPHPKRCKTDLKRRITTIIIASVGASTIVATLVIIFCVLTRKSFPSKLTIFPKKKTGSAQKVEAFLMNYRSLSPRRYKYLDIKKMTNSFKHKLGQGGYGSVYKGRLLDGPMVAVKLLNESKGNGEEFINEVASISSTSHINVVKLIGFCVESKKRALIYEFMPNGSLEKFIYDKINPHHLGWKTLYNIALGIARGLEYLHRGCNTRILHFDIKPHNILLDQGFCPKISDFGLSKLCLAKESIVSMTGARGTAGYIAPELISRNFGVVSHKSDVYSYGMMVLEIVGGRKNVDARAAASSQIYFPEWIYNHLDQYRDLGLQGVTTAEDKEISKKMVLVGLWCIQIDPLNRPPMNKVLDMLVGSLEELQIPPKPFLSSPPIPQEDLSSISILSSSRP